MGQLSEWTLSRGIQPPVSFVGELLYHHDGVPGITLWQSLISRGRWHAISVFTTREGRLVVYICFRSRVHGELDNRDVFWCDALSGLPMVFEQYQNVAFPMIARRIVGGAIRQQREAMEAMARFQGQVAQLLLTLQVPRLQLG